MNLEQVDFLPATMEFHFGFQGKWMQRCDKNSGDYTMVCTALPDGINTYRALITNAMHEDTGAYLGVPSVTALRKQLHHYFSQYIIGGKIVLPEVKKEYVEPPRPIVHIPDHLEREVIEPVEEEPVSTEPKKRGRPKKRDDFA